LNPWYLSPKRTMYRLNKYGMWRFAQLERQHMKTRMLLSRAVLTLSLVVGSAASASATTISYFGTLSYQTVNFTDDSLLLQQFNPSLGTLNSVTVTLLGNDNGNSTYTEIKTQGYFQNSSALGNATGQDISYRVVLDSADDSDFNLAYATSAYIMGISGGAAVNSSTLQKYSGYDYSTDANGHAAVVAENVTVPGGGNAAIISTTGGNGTKADTLVWNFSAAPTSDSLGSSVSCSTPGNDCASRFEGLGTFGLVLDASGNYFGSVTGSANQEQHTEAQVVAMVTYDYTEGTSTPEPATMGLMGSALIGLGVLGKKLRRQ